MIKNTNERIAITLTKEQLKQLNIISGKSGYSKSILIKLAIDKYIKSEYSTINNQQRFSSSFGSFGAS